MNRRDFLVSASALAILPLPSFAAQNTFRLQAESVTQQVLPQGDAPTPMLGFNGSMPGPELRVRRGERVSIEVENGLDEGTAVHWHAGTYWYHSHYISHEQVARGMMGPLIVEDDTPPDVDHDITVLMSDWRMMEDGTLSDEFTDMHSVAHGGYMGNFARAFLSKDEVKSGDRVRFRLINAATNRIFPVTLSGVSGSIVALDGMALTEPRSLDDIVST